MGAIVEYTDSQMRTIKNTVAADTNAQEFDLFMGAAKSYGLDPFRKQISAIVFSKDKPGKRKMAIIVGRDGLRAIAQRCGDYRPASKAADIEYDVDLKSDGNPKGIVKASVELHKQDSNGNWYPVFGEAYWDEFVPLREIWGQNQSGIYQPTGDHYPLDGNWKKMPIIMLTKCAEAQALRAGWPDEFGGVYAEEEMQATQAKDITPSERVNNETENMRNAAIGKGRSILMTLDDTGVFQRVDIGEMADRCFEYIDGNNPVDVHAWSIQNREPLKEFWAASPNDALAVKAKIEDKTKGLGEQ